MYNAYVSKEVSKVYFFALSVLTVLTVAIVVSVFVLF